MSDDPRDDELRLLLEVLCKAEKCRAAQRRSSIQRVFLDPLTKQEATGAEAALDAAILAYHRREQT